MPPTPPALQLLGPPTLQVGDRTLPFQAERPYLLLGLLACRRDWLRRDELADLLYPGRDLPAARSNLRKVLHLARRLADDIEQRGDLLRWSPDSDLGRFEAACNAQQHDLAVALYGGPLMLGLDPAWPPGSMDWLHAERQRLQARWHGAAHRRLVELMHRNAEQALTLAQALLRADPLDDTALHALSQAQHRLGRSGDALRSLGDFSRRLGVETGLAPSAALQALGESLRAPDAPAPVDGPDLVGRRHELAQIARRLSEPGCRVLTLLGPAGVGKSALARSALSRHGSSALWVPLEHLRHAEQVPAAIASAAGLMLSTAMPPWAALDRALDGRTALLVLDNAEHLSLAPELQALLARQPSLRVLAASREPLGVNGEWRLPVGGLPLPDADETDPEVLRANDAVQLFERRARPLAPAFDLSAEAAEVVRLVHEVDGLPLAIELLAAWRRVMPVREILAELAESLDVLEPAAPHERSVRASFNRAWQQLGALEQRVLSQLAVLPAPASRDLVRTVLQAPLPVLAALVDRSLLQADDGGWFTLHPLIRRCSAPFATEVDALLERHARHLAQRLAASDSGDRAEAAHVRAAWQWAQARSEVPVLRRLITPLSRRAQDRQGRKEVLHGLAAARLALDPRLSRPWPARATAEQLELAGTWAALAVAESLVAYELGDLDRVIRVAQAGLDLAREMGDPELQFSSLGWLGKVHWQRGRYAQALAAFDQQASLLVALHDESKAGQVRASRALVFKSLGHYDEACLLYETSFAAIRQQGEPARHLYLFNNLANLLRLLGRGAEALALLHEGLQICRDLDPTGDRPFLLTNVALVHETLREFTQAARWGAQALASARDAGAPMIEAAALLLQARVQAALQPAGPVPLELVQQALAIAEGLEARPMQVQCLSTAGVALARCGSRVEGLALVRWSQRHPEFVRSEREDAERHLVGLAPDASEEALALRMLPAGTSLDDAMRRFRQHCRP